MLLVVNMSPPGKLVRTGIPHCAALSPGTSVMAPITCRDPGDLWVVLRGTSSCGAWELSARTPPVSSMASCPYPERWALGEESVDGCRHSHGVSGPHWPAGVPTTYPPTQTDARCPVSLNVQGTLQSSSTSVNTEGA